MLGNSTTPRKCYAFADLRNADMSGGDYTDASFAYAKCQGANFANSCLDGAQLGCANFRDADLQDAEGANIDARSTIFDGANLPGAEFLDSNATGASMISVVVRETVISNTYMLGVKLLSLDMQGSFTLEIAGRHAVGIQFPHVFNPEHFYNLYECHEGVAALICLEYPDDPEMQEMAGFLLLRRIDCWHGFVRHIRRYHPKRYDDFEALWQRYPSWRLWERWQVGVLMADCESLEDWEALRDHELYQVDPWTGFIDRWIRRYREAA